ncbi:NUDIX hydrolase [Anaerosacchariphilus polymeriproducens]|uniref:NUDIX hydrolase n=1 Tax=Anaerosacchariphilus polymeriproducens TaxID=1812858 RepID=A0A371B088_9FIRM|nr:NUDIX hydrolase [Anaerosacchariphilus polymeriproducens]RDU25237.1 NUDIX hydrolase [Anaerosacchariphilus polymeriproducens]
MGEAYKRVKRELVHEGAIVKFYADYVQLPGGKIAKWDFIEHKGAAAVVPVMENGKILMVRQYRNALDRFTLEIPAGVLDSKDEPAVKCAARELEEETGYCSNDLEFLISLRTTVAFCNEKIDVYVAQNLIPTKQNLDEDEFVEIQECELEYLLEKIFEGSIQDSKTVSAILAYNEKYIRNKK